MDEDERIEYHIRNPNNSLGVGKIAALLLIAAITICIGLRLFLQIF